jgi:endonuclease/exonuclease/phosphatase family metal-dependent hydrolase
MLRDGASVNLMTYNIHRWAGRDQRIDIDRLADVIKASDADLIGLNEVLHPVTTKQRTYEPLAELAERLDMNYAFGPSGWMDFGPDWYGPVGNALLSRYPLTDVSNTWLPRFPSTKQRSLLGATFNYGAVHELTAFVTHLDHAFEGTRLHQISGIIKHIARRSPHFLMGDFNTPGFLGPNTRRLLPPVLRMMRRAGYEDAFHAVGHGHGKTFPAHSPLVRIDFLFMPRHWARGFLSARALNSGITQHASDHRPLLVEWGWSDSIAAFGRA